MAFQDEQESQIEPLVSYVEDELSSSPSVPPHAHQIDVVEQQANGHIQEACNDDTVLDHEISSPVQEYVQHESCDSFVQDTQFAGIELDTQGTDRFDDPSATCDPADIPKSGPRPVVSNGMLPQLLTKRIERPAVEIHSPAFRFGPGPNPGNMKLTRPHPGTTSSVDHRNISKNIAQPIVAAGSAQESQYVTVIHTR
jgi:hypothetical protein